jgi:ribosomal protein S18 acetylase RimI-like enzyme
VTDVRKATRADLDAISASLAKAFWDDPVMLHILPQSDRGQAKKLEGLMRIEAISGLRHESVWTTEDRQATAIWKPPNKWKVGGMELLRQAPSTIAILRSRLPTALSVLNIIEKKHPVEPPHWHLAVLGTEPDGQGKGKGSSVLQPVLEQCDRAGEGAYLESSKERNVPFYERHGFRVTERIDLPKGGPSLWLMWRDPQPA